MFFDLLFPIYLKLIYLDYRSIKTFFNTVQCSLIIITSLFQNNGSKWLQIFKNKVITFK